ncbi:SDR family oxidoreductase [Rhodohalobacter sp. SW132]|uniref:SDR family oxidoreductase n=1 Tax=Rhodohalobacter sp. SW132 TaxID=2293433 RepID=UPI000E22FB87|nr:SDR family oxidoreductase [Rhodohalobacter sp. SW132]REL33520.1 SDR family oxidoreductase [Rhodohalobacter sp. SW132]
MSNHYVVTGSSRGIGYELVKSLANKNHLVTVVARSEEKLTSLRSLFPEQIFPITADITTEEGRNTLIGHIKEKSISLDGIVHNAGLLIKKPFEELTDDDWNRQLDVNLLAPVFLTRDLLPHMNSGSHILNIGSMGGFQGSSKFPGLSAYSVAKGALSVLTECLAAELADRNISSNCLCLGAVQTEMFEAAFPDFQAPVQPGDMGRYISEFLLDAHKLFNGRVLPVSLADPS